MIEEIEPVEMMDNQRKIVHLAENKKFFLTWIDENFNSHLQIILIKY